MPLPVPSPAYISTIPLLIGTLRPCRTAVVVPHVARPRCRCWIAVDSTVVAGARKQAVGVRAARADPRAAATHDFLAVAAARERVAGDDRRRGGTAGAL